MGENKKASFAPRILNSSQTQGMRFPEQTPTQQQNSLISRLRNSTRKRSNHVHMTTDPRGSGVPGNETFKVESFKKLQVPKADNMSLVSTSDVSEIESLGALGFSLGSWRSKSSKQNYYSHNQKSLSTTAMNAAMLEERNRSANNNSLLAPPQPQIRPSTSPVCSQHSVSAGPHSKCQHKRFLFQRQQGRSLSLKDPKQMPAALLVGDYLIAPLYEWAERLIDTSQQAGCQGEENQADDASTSTMPGTPCLTSTCGEEFDLNTESQLSTIRKHRSNRRSLLQRVRRSFMNKNEEENNPVSNSVSIHTSDFLRFGPLFSCAVPRRFSFGSSFSDEDPPSIQPRTLEEYTPLLKNVIRAIRRMHVLVARRKFKEALKPYDVKDVIEQYSAGHVDLQARVKQVQQKLDQIVGGKQANKEDLKVNLVSRVVKVEKQVEKIDKKLDLLVEMFLEDRRQRLVNTGSGIRTNNPNVSRQRHRTDSSPPHSAAGRFSNNSDNCLSQQSPVHRNFAKSSTPTATEVQELPREHLRSRRQISLLASLPSYLTSSLNQSLDEPRAGPSRENAEIHVIRSHSNEPHERSPLLHNGGQRRE